MSWRYMLDTDISSYIMKKSQPAVLEHLRRIPPVDICISVITKCELAFGIQVSPRKIQDASMLAEFLRYVAVADFSDTASTDYAEIRATLKQSGSMIGANDLLIAAHARALGCILVSNNTREFSRVPYLQVENWGY